MSRKRLILADPLAEEGVRVLREAQGLVVEDLSDGDREELRRRLPGAAGLIVRSATRVDEDLLEPADALEVIGRAGVGIDNVDLGAASRRGITVLNAPAGNRISTAEMTFALLLAVARRVTEADRSVREGRWERGTLRGVQLGGRMIGVVGAGRIGTEVVRRARAFGMDVLVADPFLPAERAAELEVEVVPLDELLPRVDFLTIHVPLRSDTRLLIGRRELARMKPTAILVNAARGGIVDEHALAEALAQGRLGGAGVDVCAEEPLPPDHPLLTAPGVVLTPHLGAQTAEAQRDVAVEIAEAVRDALLHGEVRGAVNLPSPEEAAATGVRRSAGAATVLSRSASGDRSRSPRR